MRNLLLLCTILTLGCDAPDPELDVEDVETETEGAEPEGETEEELDDESSGGEIDPPDPQGGDAFHWPRRPTHPGPCDRPRPTLAVEG
jgi:hypothetical protein